MGICTNCGKMLSDSATRCCDCLAEHTGDDISNLFITTTTNNIEGYEIIEYFEPVYGESVAIGGLIGFLLHHTFFLVSCIDYARKNAITIVKNNALKKGANAIVGLHVDMTCTRFSAVSEICGTPVKIVHKSKIQNEEKKDTIIGVLKSNTSNKDVKLKNTTIKKSENSQRTVSSTPSKLSKEKINEMDKDKIIARFAEVAKKMSSYMEIKRMWLSSGMNEADALSDFTEAINKQAEIERMYGSNSKDIPTTIDKWANGDFS